MTFPWARDDEDAEALVGVLAERPSGENPWLDDGTQILGLCGSPVGLAMTVSVRETAALSDWLECLVVRLRARGIPTAIGPAPPHWLPYGFPLPDLDCVTAGVDACLPGVGRALAR